jgi:hypothetical protein
MSITSHGGQSSRVGQHGTVAALVLFSVIVLLPTVSVWQFDCPNYGRADLPARTFTGKDKCTSIGVV